MKRTKTALACVLAASLALFTPAYALAGEGDDAAVSDVTAAAQAAARAVDADADAQADGIEALANKEAAYFFFDTGLGEEHWYVHDGSLDYVVDNDLIKGYQNGEYAGMFRPWATISRAEVATILWRIAGEPEPEGANPFKDVYADDWYVDAVTWASELNIIRGYTANGVLTGNFGPNDNVTRQDLATMMGRMADYAYGKNIGEDYVSTSMTKMPDADDVATYAVPWLGWCFDNDIMTGVEGVFLDPEGQAQRCQMAKMTRVLCTLLGVPEYPTTQAEREQALHAVTVNALDEGFASSATFTEYEVYIAPAQTGLQHSLVIDFTLQMTASQFWSVAPGTLGELTAAVGNLGETIYTAGVAGSVDIPVFIRLYDINGELLLGFRNGELQ